jgi:hypothetical protein
LLRESSVERPINKRLFCRADALHLIPVTGMKDVSAQASQQNRSNAH